MPDRPLHCIVIAALQPNTAQHVRDRHSSVRGFYCDENAGCAFAFLYGKKHDMALQRSFAQTTTGTLEQRQADEAHRLRKKAQDTPAGIERDRLIRRAREAETASHMNYYMRSPGLKAPT
jgi:hypothetical protein